MAIRQIPEVLTWTTGAGVLRRVYESYVEELSRALGQLMSRLVHQGHDTTELQNQLDSSSHTAFLRVLTAPEVSYRIIYKESCTPGEAANFIQRSLQSEMAREGRPTEFNYDMWTPYGDMCFRSDGSVFRFPQISATMPLDFGSPLVAKVDLGGPGNGLAEMRAPFDASEMELVIERLNLACQGIHALPALLDFVLTFNKVLIFVKDPAAPNQFSSGSTTQYVGRTFITNPHVDSVDIVDLAEALVHEGIHALLFMEELLHPWGDIPELRDGVRRVDSPWTGNSLSLSSFLQACFVWYGLAHFWALALREPTFDPLRIKQRFIQAVCGFLNGQVVHNLEPFLPGIYPDVVDTIEEMQARILDAFGDNETQTREAMTNAPLLDKAEVQLSSEGLPSSQESGRTTSGAR
jgi:hypothetical protein